MVLLKWFTLTILALFYLNVLIQTTSGIRCYQCQRFEVSPMNNWGDCEKLSPDNPEFDFCQRAEKEGHLVLKMGRNTKTFKPEFKCETHSDRNPLITCYCFTDGCNSRSIKEWKSNDNGNGGTRVGVDRTIIFGMTLVSAILIKI